MKFLDTIKEKILYNEDGQPENNLFMGIVKWVYKLRGIFLCVPVAFAAIFLAFNNAFNLPEAVSLNIPYFTAEGIVIELVSFSRSVAVTVPLIITALCIVMVFLSKRVSYPWLISVFSLVLPLFIYFTTIFP